MHRSFPSCAIIQLLLGTSPTTTIHTRQNLVMGNHHFDLYLLTHFVDWMDSKEGDLQCALRILKCIHLIHLCDRLHCTRSACRRHHHHCRQVAVSRPLIVIPRSSITSCIVSCNSNCAEVFSSMQRDNEPAASLDVYAVAMVTFRWRQWLSIEADLLVYLFTVKICFYKDACFFNASADTRGQRVE